METVKICKYCENEFFKNKRGIKDFEKRKFCSLKCFNNSRIWMIFSDEIRKNMSEWRIWMRLTIEHKINIWKNNRWEKSGTWKGGISKIDKLCRRLPEYKQWRSDIFTRDMWACKTCWSNGIYVTAHHIKWFSKIIKENNIKNITEAKECNELWELSNWVTLCEKCHELTDNYKGRVIKSNN